MSPQQLADFSDARGRAILVALSGGADSTALLCLLHEQREELSLRLSALHVHHGLRGADADGDAEFCEALCQRLDIPFRCVHIDLSGSAEGLETAARERRYQALYEALRRENADYIALAHHRRDQAETVLMHLLRGAGMRGVGGMRRIDGKLYRPLLDVPPEALRKYLNAIGQPWREDATNQIPDNPRNRVRLQLLPVVEDIYPGGEQAIARFADIAQAEDAYMRAMAERFAERHVGRLPNGVRLTAPEEIPRAILRRLLMTMTKRTLPYEHIIALEELCREGKGGCSLPDGLTAVRTGTALYLTDTRFACKDIVPFTPNGIMNLPAIGTLTAAPARPEPIRDDPFTQVLDAEALQGCVLRTRRTGDRMRPLGTGEKKLKDILIGKKIDRPLRDTLPLLAKGDRVMWLIGYGISEEVKLTEKTKTAVRVEWKPK